MTKKELYIEERKNGMSYSDISRKYRISRQAVYAACKQVPSSDIKFRKMSPKDVVYPVLYRWMVDNRVGKNRLLDFFDEFCISLSYTGLDNRLRGKMEFRKSEIDALIRITGMKYEELFMEEQ